jgi:hypothetical protein
MARLTFTGSRDGTSLAMICRAAAPSRKVQ